MPYKSRAQAAYFNIHRAELERHGVNVDEWNSASKGMKLPKHAQAGGAQMGPMGPMGPPGAGDPIGSMLQRYMMDELMRQMQSRSREGIIPPELLYMQRGINPSRGMGDPMEIGGTNQLPGWQKAFNNYHPKVPSEFEPEPFMGEADLPMRPHSREFGPPTNEFPGLFEGEPFNPPQRQEGGPAPYEPFGGETYDQNAPEPSPKAYEPFRKLRDVFSQRPEDYGGKTSHIYKLLKHLYGGVEEGAKGTMEASEGLRQTGEYNAKEPFMAALNTAGASMPFAVRGAAGTFGGILPSILEREIAAAKTKSASPEQWMGYLQGRPGVKKDELEWLKLQKFLEERAAPPPAKPETTFSGRYGLMGHNAPPPEPPAKPRNVTQEELHQYVGRNVPEYTESFYKETPALRDVRQQMIDKYGDHPIEAEMTWQDRDKLYDARRADINNAKFSTYSSDLRHLGGDNYRERVVSLQPQKPSPEALEAEAKRLLQRMSGGRRQWETIDDYDRQYYLDMATDELEGRVNSHFPEKHYNFHLRENDLNLEGKKDLHIQEGQSDLMQKIREHGGTFDPEKYAQATNNFDKVKEEYRKADSDLRRKASETINDSYRANATPLTPEQYDALYQIPYLAGNPESMARHLPHVPEDLKADVANVQRLHDERAAAHREYRQQEALKGLPNVPMQQSPKWTGLAFRRLLSDAVHNGYERISWSPGSEQAERYWGPEKNRQLTGFSYDKDSKYLYGYNAENKHVFNKSNVKPEDLDKVVGNKEVADQLRNNPRIFASQPTAKLPEGQSRDLAREQMEGSYDKIWVNVMNDLVKKYGVKVQRYETDVPKSHRQMLMERKAIKDEKGLSTEEMMDKLAELENNGRRRKSFLYYIDITPKMREAIINKTDPKLTGLFNRGGAVMQRARGGHIPNLINSGLLKSDVPGRTDNLNIHVPSGAYVIPADVVAGEGQGNTDAGAKKFHAMFSSGPLGMKTLKGRGSGPKVGHLSRIGTTRLPRGSSTSAVKQTFQSGGAPEEDTEGQPTPILAAGGEFIVHPHVARRIGRGDLKQGHRILDAFVLHARKQHVKQIKNLKPPVKP